MGISVRSCLTTGVSAMTVATIVLPTSVQPQAPAAPTIQLAASVQQTAQPADYLSQLFDWWQPIFWPSASRALPTPPTVPTPTPGSIPSTLEWAYHAIEPWVRYGFEVATYAV